MIFRVTAPVTSLAVSPAKDPKQTPEQTPEQNPLSRGLGFLAKVVGVSWVSLAGLSVFPLPVLAHHPLGGRLPASGFEGFLSGLAHPMIGPDHFLFVLAIGLLAVTQVRGLWLPVVFAIAGLGGTLLHLAELDLPLLELAIALSLVLAGWLLARRQAPGRWSLLGLGAIAGIFHGYAYGEAIVGAEASPLGGYLLGLALIQIGVAAAVYGLAKFGTARVLGSARVLDASETWLRYAGFTILGAGIAFLSGTLA